MEIAGAAISNKRRDEMWRKVLFRKSCEGESYEEEFREAETLPNDEERSEEDAKEKKDPWHCANEEECGMRWCGGTGNIP